MCVRLRPAGKPEFYQRVSCNESPEERPMEASSKIFSARVRRAVLAVAGAALVMWTALLAHVPSAPPPAKPSAQVAAPETSLAALALQNARSLEATRDRLANEWQSTHIQAD